MARASCAQCGNQVSYSDPGLERAGLKSDAWANLVSRTGFLCFDCLGSSKCSKCGTTLGSMNGTIHGHNYEATYCGQPTCVSCTKETLRAKPIPRPVSQTTSNVPVSRAKPKKGFFGRVLFILGAVAAWFAVSLFVGSTGEEMAILLIWLPATVYLGFRVLKMLLTGR